MQFARSFETEQIFKALKTLKQGDSISEAELSKMVGFSLKGQEQRIRYVREALTKAAESVIEKTPGGLRRLTDDEIVNRRTRQRKRQVQGAAFRGSRELAAVDYDAMTPANQTAHNAHQAAFGAIGVFTKEESHIRLEGAVVGKGVVLPPKDVLRLFEK